MIKSSAYENNRLKIIAENVEGKTVLDLGYAQMPNP
jgi:hypothetical protein